MLPKIAPAKILRLDKWPALCFISLSCMHNTPNIQSDARVHGQCLAVVMRRASRLSGIVDSVF